jgi:murein DD-endopeptidase MepM/ murein hydrolase activator NlpD
VRRHRHLRQTRIRRFQSAETRSVDPNTGTNRTPAFAATRRLIGVACGLVLLAGASAVTLVSFGEAARPFFDGVPETVTVMGHKPLTESDLTLIESDLALGDVSPPTEPPPAESAPVEQPLAAAPTVHQVVVENGDTLASVLGKADISQDQALAAIKALSAVYDPRQLQIGQEIALTLNPDDAGLTLVGLELSPRFDRYAGITLFPDGDYRSFVTPKALTKTTVASSGVITSSLFGDGMEAGIPAATMADFLRLFSFDIDFERDVQPDDRFEVVFERYLDRDGNVVHTGNLLYAGFTVGGKDRSYYRYSDGDGDDAFYGLKGQGIRKALLKTPVDGARRSSGFGMRRHPVLGYTKMHTGIDFAASRGTPIRAAGDGVLTFAGRKGGYGNYIAIRHNGDYATAYAHMHKFARGMRSGKRVKQGQVIGYVGSTGRSTGPHLHYEVMLKGKRLNPSKLRLPSGRSLKGADFKRFQQQIAVIDALRQAGTDDELVAAR